MVARWIQIRKSLVCQRGSIVLCKVLRAGKYSTWYRQSAQVVVVVVMVVLMMTMTMVMVSFLGNSDSTQPTSERVRVWFPPCPQRSNRSTRPGLRKRERERESMFSKFSHPSNSMYYLT